MTNLQTQILNHKWKKCPSCRLHPESNSVGCEDCFGSGFEPMEIENPRQGIPPFKEGEIIEIDKFGSSFGINKIQIIKTNNKKGWGVIPYDN